MKKTFILILSLIFLPGIPGYSHAGDGSVTVVSYAGDVKITPSGAVVERQCEPGMLLGAGDRIRTGQESYLEIALKRRGENILRIEENSDVVIKLDGPEKIELIDGKIFLLLRDLKRGETFRVRTPCGVCGARGTGWMTMVSGNIMNVAVFQDRVFSRGVKKDGSVMEDNFWISEGFMRNIKKFRKPGKQLPVPPDELEKMRKLFGLGKKGKMKKRSALFDRMRKLDEKRTRGILNKKNDDKLEKIRGKEEKTGGGVDPYP